MRWPYSFSFLLLTSMYNESRRKDEATDLQRDIGCVRMIGRVDFLLTYQKSTCGVWNHLMIWWNMSLYIFWKILLCSKFDDKLKTDRKSSIFLWITPSILDGAFLFFLILFYLQHCCILGAWGCAFSHP